MRNPGLSIRVFVTLTLLVALLTIANPAAADPGAVSGMDVVFSQGPPVDVNPGGDVQPECAWWWPWC